MQPLEEKIEQQQEQLEQNEEMEQAQEQEQLEETPQDDAPEGYRIDFAVRYVDIFEGLEATDKADGTNKKPKRLFVILTLLMYLGRVGPVSFALSLVAGSSSRKEIMPEGKIVVG